MQAFDPPPPDTLVLAMPVSWKGTLQQYAGRLHRKHASKTDVRIIYFVDTGHPHYCEYGTSASVGTGDGMQNSGLICIVTADTH